MEHFTSEMHNDSPIRLNLETIRLVISTPDEERQRLAALSPEDVPSRALGRANANPSVPAAAVSYPGSGLKSGKGKAWDEMATAFAPLRSEPTVCRLTQSRMEGAGFEPYI